MLEGLGKVEGHQTRGTTILNTFEVVHRFRTLSNRNFITPLACRMCSQELTIRLGTDDEPTTKCFTCGAKATVSMATLIHMQTVINQYEGK